MGALIRTCVAAASILAATAVQAAPVPPLDLSVTSQTRLLVISPHPDDEALAAAGLIKRVVDAGGAVRIVLLTSGDGFSEGVEVEDRITRPTPSDYRNYGTLRERETRRAMRVLGVARASIAFLGFPDDGLCRLASAYYSAKRPAYESPYTDRVSPPLSEQVIRGVRYRGIDVRSEIERIVTEFAPTVVAMPHPEDEHPDHCSAHIFATEALKTLSRQPHAPSPRVLHYVIHDGQWPLDVPAGELTPPRGFPEAEGRWVSLALSEDEAAAKRLALQAYASQTLVIGRFLQAFARGNELFLEGEPASLPECWCDGDNVATELPPEKYRRRAVGKRPPARD